MNISRTWAVLSLIYLLGLYGNMPTFGQKTALLTVKDKASGKLISNEIDSSHASKQLAVARDYETRGMSHASEQIKAATYYLEKARQVYLELGKDRDELRVLAKLAPLYAEIYENENALSLYFQLLDRYEKQNDSLKIAQTHSGISGVYDEMHRYDKAMEHGQKALKMAQDLHSQRGIAALSNNLASLYLHADSLYKTFALLQQAVRINQEMENRNWLAVNHLLYADIYEQLSLQDSVHRHLLLALSYMEGNGSLSDSLAAFRKLGIHYYHLGQKDEALSYFDQGISLAKRMGSLKSEANLNHWISEVYRNAGETELAMHYLQNQYELKDSLALQQDRRKRDSLELAYEVKQLENKLKAVESKTSSPANKEQGFPYLWILAGLLGLTAFWGWTQMRKPSSVETDPQKENNLTSASNAEKKYARSGLSEEKKQEILGDLQNLMKRDRIYQDQSLQLDAVADRLEISRTYLSQIINESFSQNFNQYINGHRIALAQELLRDPNFAHYSIQGIAETAGFRSLSTFNHAFKKASGLTPSQFRKKGKA